MSETHQATFRLSVCLIFNMLIDDSFFKDSYTVSTKKQQLYLYFIIFKWFLFLESVCRPYNLQKNEELSVFSTDFGNWSLTTVVTQPVTINVSVCLTGRDEWGHRGRTTVIDSWCQVGEIEIFMFPECNRVKLEPHPHGRDLFVVMWASRFMCVCVCVHARTHARSRLESQFTANGHCLLGFVCHHGNTARQG